MTLSVYNRSPHVLFQGASGWGNLPLVLLSSLLPHHLIGCCFCSGGLRSNSNSAQVQLRFSSGLLTAVAESKEIINF